MEEKINIIQKKNLQCMTLEGSICQDSPIHPSGCWPNPALVTSHSVPMEGKKNIIPRKIYSA